MATFLEKDETGSLLKADVTSNAVLEQLDRILQSEPFRNSKRHPRFLRFVVGKLLEGSADQVKERIIGIEVFDRANDYDASADPIVRVAAGEIRKRLAQYYLVHDHAEELRFELHVGSYLPTIYWPAASEKRATDVIAPIPLATPETPKETSAKEVLPPTNKSHTRAWLILAACALVLIAVLAGALRYSMNPDRDLNAFWKPMLDSGAVKICVGDLNYLMASPAANIQVSIAQAVRGQNHLDQDDTTAAVGLASNLGAKGVRSSLLVADVATLTDLRGQPTVLIGAFGNRWTDKILENARYRPVWNADTHWAKIMDAQHPEKSAWEINCNAPISAINYDYAIVARTISPLTGQPTVILAGVGPYGTFAASEFLTNPKYFKQFTDRAPKGWQAHNIEIVISTQVVDGRSAPPVVLAYDIR